MDLEAQKRAPIYEALERFRKKRVVPFDVPGHKRGRGNPELAALLGEKCVGLDVNSMKPLDNLCHPVSVIREAEELRLGTFTFEDAAMKDEVDEDSYGRGNHFCCSGDDPFSL